MNTAPPLWHLLGLGAIGCLYTAYLHRAGIAITPIVRDVQALHHLQKNGGIALHHNNKTETISVDAITINAVAPLSTLAQPIAQLLICTKAHQTLAAIRAIKPYFTADPLLVLIQNGMGARELIQHEIPGAIILHAISTEGAFRTARFAVTHAGRGDTTIGAIDPQQQTWAEYAAHTLQCELPITIAADIERRLWIKLAVNSVINPLTAIHRCRNGELLQSFDIDKRIADLCAELAAVAQAENLLLTAEQLRAAVFRVINDTAQNRSSMLQDIEAGRNTEIDFINGFIVRRAQIHRIDCIHHAQLLASVHALEPHAP